MKNIILLTILLFSFNSFSQLGINTHLPLGTFHIGNKDYDTYTDNFIITPEGNIGIGLIKPQNKLVVNNTEGSTTGIVLTTGAEDGKVLMSDKYGNANWSHFKIKRYNGFLDKVHNPKGFNIYYTERNYLYSGWNISLPPGTWLVKLGMYMFTHQLTQIGNNEFVQLNATFMDSSVSGSLPSSDILQGGIASGTIYGGTIQRSMLTGNMIIKNTTTKDKTYYLFAGNIIENVAPGPGKPNVIQLFAGPYGEDYILATPIDF